MKNLELESVDKTITSINKFLNYDSEGIRAKSNCWHTALSVALRGIVDLNFRLGEAKGAIPDPHSADNKLLYNFTQINNPKFGDDTRFALPDGTASMPGVINAVDKGNLKGGTSHYATFLLKNESTSFYFSKNGSGGKAEWDINTGSSCKLTDLQRPSDLEAPITQKNLSNMKNLFIITFLVFSLNTFAQLDPLGNYLQLTEEKLDYDLYKINGKKYLFYRNCIISDLDTIYKKDTLNLLCYTLFKERYLFISCYPKEEKIWSTPFFYRVFKSLSVIDLKSPYKKWHYNFTGLTNEHRQRITLGNILSFKPKTGEIIFDIRFSINSESELKHLPNSSLNIPSY